jgi:hypothetical protein
MLELSKSGLTETSTIKVVPRHLVIAGWTGRDKAALEDHIEELAKLGVARPKVVPMYYRVGVSLLSPDPQVQVVGRNGSGEAEVVLWKHDGELLVGVGSDHTDRAVEAVGITISKQLCPKPVSATVWPWVEVAGHWDQLVLSSTLPRTKESYQRGCVGSMVKPIDLVALFEARHGPFENGTVMFCGTLPALGGIRYADEMCIELQDPVLGRSIRHSYTVAPLPVAEA